MRTVKSFWILGVVFAMLASNSAAQQDCVGEGDTNGDGLVDPLDGGFVLARFGCEVDSGDAGCDAADTNGDGVVDPLDSGFVAARFGATYLNYGPHRDNLEAEMLAMAVSGEIRAPDFAYDRILGDMALIRIEFPELITVVDDTDYVPNQLIVSVDDDGPIDDYEALNDFFLVVDEEINTWGRVLTFCDNLNAVVAAVEYAGLDEVNWAEPNYFIGIDDYITVTLYASSYRYSIDDGFWDCFDGCDCHRYWEIDVTGDGTVTLISYSEEGAPWCEFD